jgi:hypothetical protein
MPTDSPTGSDIDFAVARATAARRNRHRANAAHCHLTDAAIAERVAGVACCPQQREGGWWLVGRVLDDIAGAEFDVWYIPGKGGSGPAARFFAPGGKTTTGTS